MFDIFDIFDEIDNEEKQEETVEVEEIKTEETEIEETVEMGAVEKPETEEDEEIETVEEVNMFDDFEDVNEEETEETEIEEIAVDEEIDEKVETNEEESAEVEDEDNEELEGLTSEEADEIREERAEMTRDEFNYNYISEEYLDGEEVNKSNLNSLLMDDLRDLLDNIDVEYLTSHRKPDLISLILEASGIKIEEDEEETNEETENIVAEDIEEEKQEEEKEEIKEEKDEEKIKAAVKDIKEKTARVTRSKKRVDIELEDNIIVNMPLTDMSYEEALEVLQPSFVDQEWNIYKTEIDERLGSIQIEDDMNPGTLKLTISELSELRQEVWFNYQKIKTLYETLGSKEPEGLIERVKKIAYNPNDRNDMERRRTGIKACLEYVAPNTDTPINLFEILDETRERYNFLKAVMESIRYKTNALITMNGALKLEHSHLE